MAFKLNTEELRSFHSIDRELFRRLVISLGRDPNLAMEIIALWIWLETAGYLNLVDVLRPVPDIILDGVFEEAVTCLYHIDTHTAPAPNDDNIPLTLNLMKRPISVRFLYDNRVRARAVISKTVDNIFPQVFEDIVQEAQQLHGNQGVGVAVDPFQQVQPTVDEGNDVQGNDKTESVASAQGLGAGYHPLLDINSLGPQSNYEVGESSNADRTTSESDQDNSSHGRTLFVTFSRGYPLTDQELYNYFKSNFGDILEAIHMEAASQTMQTVSALLVFRSPSTVGRLLGGTDSAMLVINGKEVWVRQI